MLPHSGIDTFVAEIRLLEASFPEDEIGKLAEHARQASSCLHELGTAFLSCGLSRENIKVFFTKLEPKLDGSEKKPKVGALPCLKSAMKRSSTNNSNGEESITPMSSKGTPVNGENKRKSALKSRSSSACAGSLDAKNFAEPDSLATKTAQSAPDSEKEHMTPIPPTSPKTSALRGSRSIKISSQASTSAPETLPAETPNKSAEGAPTAAVPAAEGASNKLNNVAAVDPDLVALVGSKAARSKVATQSEEGPDHILAELLMAKTIDVGSVREKLKNLEEQGEKVDLDASVSPTKGLPPPLFYSVGMKSAGLASLLIQRHADVRKRYAGKRWQGIMRGMTPLEAAVNLKEHFHGTILATRYEALEEVLARGEEIMRKQRVRKATVKSAVRMIALKKSVTKGAQDMEAALDVMSQEDQDEVICQETDEALECQAYAELRTLADMGEHHRHKSISIVCARPVHNLDDYDWCRSVGEGTFSTTSVWRHRVSGDLRALKAVPKKLCDDSWLWAEVELLRQMDHPNIARFCESIDFGGCYHIITEHCDGGELLSALIEPEAVFNEAVAARIAGQMLAAVGYLHHVKHVCHRDLKPDNFLLSERSSLNTLNLKLIDFGTARIFHETDDMTTKIYSLPYVAPEVLGPVGCSYTEVCDIWSLGVILYLLMSGQPPFLGSNDLQILKHVKDAKWAFEPVEVWDNVSSQAKELIQKMLTVDPSARISAEDARNDCWIVQDVPATAAGTGIGQKSVTGLRSFTATQKLKRCSVQLFSRHLDDEAKKGLTAALVEFDTERRGVLQVEDVECIITNLPRSHETILQMRQVLYRTAGSTDEVDYNKILSSMEHSKVKLQQEVLKSALDALDFDLNGQITSKELGAMLGRELPLAPGVGMPLRDILGLTAAEVDRILEGFKLKVGERINFKEFAGTCLPVPDEV